MNSSQQSGSLSTVLLCGWYPHVRHGKRVKKRVGGKGTLTRTGGSIAVRDLGSTGCGKCFSSSSSPADRLELDRTRLVDVVCVSARWRVAIREETEPRWRTDA